MQLTQVRGVITAASFSLYATCAISNDEAAKPNVKQCQEYAITMEAVSLERQDAGVLLFTFTIEQKANKGIRTFSAQFRGNLVDDKGDTWRMTKETVPSRIEPNAKTRATLRFEKNIGGNESKAATVSFGFPVDGNPNNRCRVTFNSMAIS